jgi:uncharacterized protein with FMN-binding domain
MVTARAAATPTPDKPAPLPATSSTPVATAPEPPPAAPADLADLTVAAVAPVPAEQGSAPQLQADVAAVALQPTPPSAVLWHDGNYTGWGLSRHGDIEVRLTIKNGGIVAVGIATCATRYPCSVIDAIIEQPLYRQGPDVDRVSRATESADAYSDAVWQALQKAEAGPAATLVTSP